MTVVYHYMYDEVFSLDPAEITSAVKERLNGQHLQKWRNELSSSSKMRTYSYRSFILDVGMEQYLLLPPYHSRQIQIELTFIGC